MSRKFFVVGNWKMNGDKAFIDSMAEDLSNHPIDPDVEVVVGSPSCYLMYARKRLPLTFGVAAQNCYKSLKGAFTGELSPLMIKDCDCEWVILGHIERRHFFGETDVLTGEKVALALDSGLKVILCIGEQLEDRQAGKTEEVCFDQLKAIANQVSDWSRIVLAYDSLWATGSGIAATPQQAQQLHFALRQWVAENVSVEVSESLRILYAGSVTAANCQKLATCPDIDGFLVGGASLKPDFINIINARLETRFPIKGSSRSFKRGVTQAAGWATQGF